MIMESAIDFIRLEKTEINDGLGGREIAFKAMEEFKGVLTTKTVKNVLEGGIIEFIPYTVMMYDGDGVTLNYEDYIRCCDGKVYRVMDNPEFRKAPSFSNIRQLQTRLDLIKHFGNAIINIG